jgi:hypothetical protein
MSLITDKLVWAIRTAAPCHHNASARWAKNVLSSYHFCRAAMQATPCIFICAACLGQSGQPACIPGIITWSTVHIARIKGVSESPPTTSPSSSISYINMSNGLSSPASTFSFIYPTTDHEETLTTGTTNDHQYDDQVVLFGATGQQSVRTDPTLVDFNPLNVDIAMCNVWFKPEAVYYNNTWWEAFQDDGSEASKLGSLDMPG